MEYSIYHFQWYCLTRIQTIFYCTVLKHEDEIHYVFVDVS